MNNMNQLQNRLPRINKNVFKNHYNYGEEFQIAMGQHLSSNRITCLYYKHYFENVVISSIFEADLCTKGLWITFKIQNNSLILMSGTSGLSKQKIAKLKKHLQKRLQTIDISQLEQDWIV